MLAPLLLLLEPRLLRVLLQRLHPNLQQVLQHWDVLFHVLLPVRLRVLLQKQLRAVLLLCSSSRGSLGEAAGTPASSRRRKRGLATAPAVGVRSSSSSQVFFTLLLLLAGLWSVLKCTT